MNTTEMSVSGKLRRLGLVRGSPIKPKSTLPVVSLPRYVSDAPSYQPPIVGPSPECCYPLWNDRPTHKYCGERSVIGKSWCPDHMRVVTIGHGHHGP